MFIARLHTEAGQFVKLSYGVSVPASIITSCGGEVQIGICDPLTIDTRDIELEQKVFDSAVAMCEALQKYVTAVLQVTVTLLYTGRAMLFPVGFAFWLRIL